MDRTLAGVPGSASGKSELLALELEQAILSGRLGPGDRLSPVRRLAAERGLAVNTVAAAYRRLAQRGLVEGRGRAGTVVSATARPGHLTVAPTSGLTDLAAGNPDPRLLPDWSPVLSALGTAGWEHPLYGGEPVLGPLAEALVADLGADGVLVDQCCLVSGALDGLERVLATNLRHGDGVAVEDPGYRPVRALLSAIGLRPVGVAVDAGGALVDGLAQALDRGVRAVVLTPRAHNPMGAAFDPERAEALAEVLAERPEVLVIEDDHAGRVAGTPFVGVGGRSERRVVIRSLAKSYGPDLRLAALAGDAVTVERVAARLAVGMGWVPHLLQQLALGLVADKEVGAALDEACRTYADRRRRFADRLVDVGVLTEAERPRSGFNVWVPVDDEGAVTAGMASRGFAVTPGASFRLHSPPAIRVSVGHADPDVLDAAADALVELLTVVDNPRLG